jgi:hypothetical protein
MNSNEQFLEGNLVDLIISNETFLFIKRFNEKNLYVMEISMKLKILLKKEQI